MQLDGHLGILSSFVEPETPTHHHGKPPGSAEADLEQRHKYMAKYRGLGISDLRAQCKLKTSVYSVKFSPLS